MALTFRSIDAIKDEKCKLIVDGFVKQMQSELFDEEEDNPYYDIPPLVIHVIIWFYHQAERFEMSGHCLKINESGDTVTCISDDMRCSVFGIFAVDLDATNNMIYKWNLEILRLEGWYEMDIGVISNRDKDLLEGDFCEDIRYDANDIFFSIEEEGHTDTNSTQAESYNGNFKEFGTGDIISIEINTKEKSISFYMNEKENDNKGFLKIDTKTYYLALTFREKGNCVKIVDFSQKLAD